MTCVMVQDMPKRNLLARHPNPSMVATTRIQRKNGVVQDIIHESVDTMIVVAVTDHTQDVSPPPAAASPQPGSAKGGGEGEKGPHL